MDHQYPDEFDHENILKKDDKAWKPIEKHNNSSVSGRFDCNICLDPVQDPVVTLCGHLYCWPCIYKWIHHQKNPSETLENEIPRCPVCKNKVSQTMIVPLYGGGLAANHTNGDEKGSGLRAVIPPRPPTPRYGVNGTRDSQTNRRPFQRQAPPPLVMPVRGMDMTSTMISPSPTIGMLGEMVSGRIFGDFDSPMFATPNSYSLAGESLKETFMVVGQTKEAMKTEVNSDIESVPKGPIIMEVSSSHEQMKDETAD
ncbi:hypothetical protein R6Q57_016095 [Mikania cordata]